MAVLVVIPARYASTRYPGKPLAELRGATGEARSLIRRSWEAASEVPGVDRVVVATDDDRIAEAARAFGAEVAMTPEACRNGTERCAAVLDGLGDGLGRGRQPPGRRAADPAVVRVGADRGDAGRPEPGGGDAGAALRRRGARRLHRGPPARPGRGDHRGLRPGGTGALLLQGGHPLHRAAARPGEAIPVFHHVGVYAYRPAALAAYAGWPVGPLETWEGLEQLRFMENGDAGALRRGRGARPGVLGAQQPERRAADRGDPAASSGCREQPFAGRRSAIVFAGAATMCAPRIGTIGRRAALSSGVGAGVSG